MLDIKKIRENKNCIQKALQTKDPTIQIDKVYLLDQEIITLKHQIEETQARRNRLAKEVGEKKREHLDTTALIKKLEESKDSLKSLISLSKKKEEELHDLISALPNIPQSDIPISLDPTDNLLISEYKTQRNFDFTPKDHLALNESLKLFDFERGAKLAGSNWPLYRGLGARLEWGLLNFMLDIHIKNGFEFYLPPLVAKKHIMYGSAHLPKFEDQLFKIDGISEGLYLIPTAESVMNGLHYDEIIPSEALPKKYVAYTPCFRKEAGAAGTGERGLIRTHQFNKVEMFCITKPEESETIYQEMVVTAQHILEELGLHYRTMLLCSADTSFAASKTIDLEVYLPGQKRYYEVSSLSNCTDFQSRRSKIRGKTKQEKPYLLHTLNGSGLATSRLMIAILENHQQEDGTIIIPKPLIPYIGGQEYLKPHSSL